MPFVEAENEEHRSYLTSVTVDLTGLVSDLSLSLSDPLSLVSIILLELSAR